MQNENKVPSLEPLVNDVCCLFMGLNVSLSTGAEYLLNFFMKIIDGALNFSEGHAFLLGNIRTIGRRGRIPVITRSVERVLLSFSTHKSGKGLESRVEVIMGMRSGQ